MSNLKRALFYFFKELKSDSKIKPFTGTQYYCPVCKTALKYFDEVDKQYLSELDKYENVYSLFQFETFNFLNFSCPKCRANDRDRLYALYFDLALKQDKNDQKVKFLEFAPNEPLRYQYLEKLDFIQYRTADLYMQNVDDKVDICDMRNYDDESFDVFLCSHVLEHVIDDNKAMHELWRILKSGGWGIIMVPIYLLSDKIIENLDVTTAAEKWKYYGQDDHLRMYSKSGFVSRLENSGFAVSQLGIDFFGADTFERCGIHRKSVLYVVKKN